MRRLRQLSMAVVLTLMLGTYALAGIIECPPAPAPPPEPSSVTATGIIETPPSAQPVAPATDPVVDVALNLMQTVLSLF
jgi:hypothetical protein